MHSAPHLARILACLHRVRLRPGLIAAAVLVLSWSGGACGDERPNIVLIVADDLGYGDLGCYGAPDVRTPALDQLAADGVRFTSFYSNGPECTPTRAALFSGRYQQRIGGVECAIGTHNVGRYDDAIRLAEQHQLGLPVEHNALSIPLKQAGYACGMFGKWHLGYEPHFSPARHGFEKSFGILGGNADYFHHTEDDGWHTLFEDGESVTRDGYLTDLIADEAVEWLQSVKDEPQPFFLYVPFTAPHTPIQGPQDRQPQPVPRDEWNKGSRDKYAEMIERMDVRIGKLLAVLDGAGLREETLVVFMSDNGGTRLARNDPYRETKGTTHEGGIRVPCIARWPKRLPSGRVVNDSALTMDFTRSLLRAAEVEPPRPLDGIDILQAIERDEHPAPRPLFWRGRRGDRTWRAVRDGNLKAVWQTEGDETASALYDLAADPAESTDLTEQHPEEFERLEQLLRDWEREVRWES